MNASKKELVFVSAIVVFSFLCSFYPGIDFQLSQSLDPIKNTTILKSKKILKSKPVRLDDKDLLFRSGYCYKVATGYNHSDFYQGNISHINTSHYWRFPISEIEALHYLEHSKKGFISNLYIPYELSLPIISIICSPDDFFSYENGIYVRGSDADFISSSTTYPTPWNQTANFYRKENDKKKIFFSFFDETGEYRYSSYSNSEISGKATRSFPQKSIRLSASKKMGNKNFNYDFFGNGIFYSTLILRNGGNDNTKSLFRDMLMQNLLSKSELAISNFIPCELFLNGEYWGIHFLQNRLDQDFISELTNCKEKNVTIVENWQLDSGDETESINLLRSMNQLESLDFEDLSEIFDMENLIEYLVGQMFFANTDWPSNNLKMYKISGSKKSDTKWRFAFFDLDYGFGYTGMDAIELDMFDYLNSSNDLFSRIFQKLMKSKEFRIRLRNKIEDFNSTIFTTKSLLARIKLMEEKLVPSITRHTNRWRKPIDIKTWQGEVELLRTFAKKRPEVFVKHVKIHLK